MVNEHSAIGHWRRGFDEGDIQKWAEEIRARLKAPQVSLGLIFMAPRFFDHATQILDIVRLHAQVPLLAGCSSTGLVADDQEIEAGAGIVLALYHLPGAQLKACRLTQDQLEEASSPAYWHMETGLAPGETNGWLVFADPFHFDADRWLSGWNAAYPEIPIVGGLASGDISEQRTQVYLDGVVMEDGGVALSIAGDVTLESVISQGCTPIGETWTITKVDRNIVYEIGNRPAYQVLLETVAQLSPEDQALLRGNLFVGLVMNEYLEDFHRGDFLVRNVLGADPASGVIAVGAFPRLGQTMQFQKRDASAATEDMESLLGRAQERLSGRPIYGGCLCSCNGRGQRLFARANHDAEMIQSYLGPVGLAGFFCNGEIGPVGGRSFLHGYTASVALFLPKSAAQQQ